MSVTGRWEGKLVDATGPTARVDLQLKSSRGRVQGEFRATFLPPTDSSCGPAAPRMVASGDIKGTERKDGGIRVRTSLETAGSTIEVELNADPSNADPHARRALFGTFRVLLGADVLTMQGGSTVLWDYAVRGGKGDK